MDLAAICRIICESKQRYLPSLIVGSQSHRGIVRIQNLATAMTGVINLFWCFAWWFLFLVILGPSLRAADLGVLGFFLAFTIIDFWSCFTFVGGNKKGRKDLRQTPGCIDGGRGFAFERS